MKAFKGILVAVLILVIVLPVGLYYGITLTNNAIASRIEKELAEYALPSSTEFVDSLSAAGKLVGNGNGMQYMGAILVKSALTKEDLEEYYGADFDYIEVRKQESATVGGFISGSYGFDNFSEADKDSYYTVICWGSKENCGDLISWLLDLDIRGH